MADGPDAEMNAATGSPARKKYVAPTLKRLGSVRDLTLGSSKGCLTETGKLMFAKGVM